MKLNKIISVIVSLFAIINLLTACYVEKSSFSSTEDATEGTSEAVASDEYTEIDEGDYRSMFALLPYKDTLDDDFVVEKLHLGMSLLEAFELIGGTPGEITGSGHFRIHFKMQQNADYELALEIKLDTKRNRWFIYDICFFNLPGTQAPSEMPEKTEIVLRSELFDYVKVGMDSAEVYSILDHKGNVSLSSSTPDAAYFGDNGKTLYVYYDIRQDEATSQDVFTVKSVKIEKDTENTYEPTAVPSPSLPIWATSFDRECFEYINVGTIKQNVSAYTCYSPDTLVRIVDSSLEYGYISDDGKIVLITYDLPDADSDMPVVSSLGSLDIGEYLHRYLSYMQSKTVVDSSDVEKIEIGMSVAMASGILGGIGTVSDPNEQTVSYCISDGNTLVLKYGYFKGGFDNMGSLRILDIQILPEQG